MVTIPGNPVADLTGYELRHLAAHLEAADRGEDLHRLLTLETSDGRNAWYLVKEAVGDTKGYLADVTIVWQLAEAKRDTPKQIKYALCRSSVASILANHPPELVVLAFDIIVFKEGH